MIPSVTLHNKTLSLPLIQGGMGVGVSLSSLAGHVMKEGAMGVISAAHPGYQKENFWQDSVGCNIQAIQEEIAKAKNIAQGKGLCGVNVMVASKNYEDYVRASVRGGADAIISGAGIPMDLPAYVEDDKVLLAPIVSSGKVARLILKGWDRHYHRCPDFIVIEGSEAGGHLGFRLDELQENKTQSLANILQDVLQEIQPYEERYGRSIPLFVAGGIYTGKEIAEYLALGASGVQMATRFIATHECDADLRFKEAFIQAGQADITLVKSPAGLPGRAIRTAFMEEAQAHRIAPNHCIGCMKPCDPQTTPYCISEALIHAVQGEIEKGLVFAGARAHQIKEIVHVHELIHELMTEMEEYVNENSLSI